MFWPCETRTSTCRSFATISSGLYRFLAIAVLLDVKDIPQLGPLQWGWIRREAEVRLRINESSLRCSFRRKLVRQLRPLLQDQLAHGATHLHAFGREQLHVDPFLLLGCKDLPSDDAELIRALVGQRHGLALLGAFRCLGDPHP